MSAKGNKPTTAENVQKATIKAAEVLVKMAEAFTRRKANFSVHWFLDLRHRCYNLDLFLHRREAMKPVIAVGVRIVLLLAVK